MEYKYVLNEFFAILRTSLTPVSIYYRCKANHTPQSLKVFFSCM